MVAERLQNVASHLAQWRPGQLSRNVGWLTGAELVSRLGRIVAAVILARQLDAVAFGIAAIALTVFEIIRVFTENGIGAAVIRAGRDDFDRITNTAQRLMWGVCTALALIQLGVGFVIETLMPGKQLGTMIASLSLVFLIMPFGLMHAYMLIRAERMKRLAAVASTQAVADHLLTAILALSGAGAWAIVLPKLLTAPIWLLGMCYDQPWQRNADAGYAPLRSLLRFSLPVLGAELLTAVRDQMDNVIVSVFLGVEALGLYYFAFNAGLGVSTALNRAFNNAVYPHLCNAGDKLMTYRRAILQLGLPLSGAYLLQAAAALFYVPVVFGPDWSHASPLVAILCLGGPARLFVDGARMFARASGQTGREFLETGGLALCVLVPFTAATPFGLNLAALASVIGATAFAVGLSLVRLSQPYHTQNAPSPRLEGALP